MALKKEVVNRVLLAKAILSSFRGGTSSTANVYLIARRVLNAHDAADLVFAAIADHQNKLPAMARTPSMMESLKAIDAANKQVAYFTKLSKVRDGLKHVGNLPNTTEWADVTDDTFEKLSGLCLETLQQRFEDFDESELLDNSEVKEHLYLARLANENKDYKVALEEIGRALCVALDEQQDLIQTQVGEVNAEDALKLTGFGVSANDFLRLQEFLPKVSRFFSDPFTIVWDQSEFGHPGNWRPDIVEFCLGASLDIALRIQNVPSVPSALPFNSLYDYKITANNDDVEVWEDLIADHLDQQGRRRFRAHKRFLKKGESIEVTGHAKPFVSYDQSPQGKSIRRAMVSWESMRSLSLGIAKAEFVNLRDVSIVCIPNLLSKRFLPDLLEMPWEDPDPDGLGNLG